MTINSKTFRATNSKYSFPVSCGFENIDGDFYDEPITYTSEMERISKRLKHFLQLENGWDGYSAVVPKETTVHNVLLVIENLKDKYLKLLNDEDIVPSNYGTISLYFEDSNNNELSIEFGKEYIGISGEVDGEEIIFDDIPVYDFYVAIDNISKLTIAN
jgi:hypothetical protein